MQISRAFNIPNLSAKWYEKELFWFQKPFLPKTPEFVATVPRSLKLDSFGCKQSKSVS
jgi:hypothetical protein